MTELEAVNTLLAVIGEAPIDKLSDTTKNEITDSALARKTLGEVKRDVLAEGWSWNTDFAVKLTPESNNQFLLDASWLKVEFAPAQFPQSNLVARGLKVYDRYKRTFELAPDLEQVQISYVFINLNWDDVPHQAQQYITIRAARIYADRFVNSNAIYAYTVQDEEYARAMLIRSEESDGEANLLWGNSFGAPQGIGYLPLTAMTRRTSRWHGASRNSTRHGKSRLL